MDTAWATNSNPKHISFPAHGSSVVTCLIFSRGRIISGSDDHSIHVYSPATGILLQTLVGHDGGIWALACHKDTLVSGSTDRTLRIWDIPTGRCTHVFGGHESTVRCLSIVRSERLVGVEEGGGIGAQEKCPQRPLIVSGSRDHSLRVWALPLPGEEEFNCFNPRSKMGEGSTAIDASSNPYHKFHLTGHEDAVRAVDARGRTAVSGSYDSTVRVWDIISGQCKQVLRGHSHKVFSVVLDLKRGQAYSGSWDKTVRIWDIKTGECLHTLTGHTLLVGLLGLSPSYLVSGSADSTLRVWDPDTGVLKQCLPVHSGAITCFQHDDHKIVSGSDGALKIWDIKDGTTVRDLLTDVTGIWQVAFKGDWCIAATNANNKTMMHVWHFGSEQTVEKMPSDIEEDSQSESDDNKSRGGYASVRVRRHR